MGGVLVLLTVRPGHRAAPLQSLQGPDGAVHCRLQGQSVSLDQGDNHGAHADTEEEDGDTEPQGHLLGLGLYPVSQLLQ